MACMGASISLVFGETNLMNWHKDLSLRERELCHESETDWGWPTRLQLLSPTVANIATLLLFFATFETKKKNKISICLTVKRQVIQRKKRFISKKCMEDVIYKKVH